MGEARRRAEAAAAFDRSVDRTAKDAAAMMDAGDFHEAMGSLASVRPTIATAMCIAAAWVAQSCGTALDHEPELFLSALGRLVLNAHGNRAGAAPAALLAA